MVNFVHFFPYFFMCIEMGLSQLVRETQIEPNEIVHITVPPQMRNSVLIHIHPTVMGLQTKHCTQTHQYQIEGDILDVHTLFSILSTEEFDVVL